MTNVQWCSGAKNCLTWSTVGPVQYRVYRGDASTLPFLLNASADSCLVRIWDSAVTTGAGQLVETPSPGSLFWYLVIGKNCDGEGAAGNATAGGRVQNSAGDCTPASCSDGVQNGSETDIDCGGGV